MTIVFSGGGTGGHFYPIIAVAQQINELAKAKRMLQPKLYYLGPAPYDPRALFENHIEFKKVEAGKLRRYFSLRNFLDLFRTLLGFIQALGRLYLIYPDVIFSKGGYASFPVLLAGRLFKIPIIIHESDSVPGRVNLWSGRFAKRIGVSYPSAARSFPATKTAVTGNPVREGLHRPLTLGARQFLGLREGISVILVLGGSQGAMAVNEVVLDILPKLVERYQIIHQTGREHFSETEKRASFLLQDLPQRERYRIFPYLNDTALRMAAGVADLVITRAGSALFEIALWGLPSIVVPIPEEISRDQRSNALTYAQSGAAVIIEQNNLTPSVLLVEIERLVSDQTLRAKMRDAAKNFARPEAAKLIAEEIINLSLQHEI